MMPHPLGLTDDQLAILKEAAKAVPYAWRSRFLVNVADELLPVEVVQNEHVHDAARRVLARMRQVA
jgi:hypothetical protein